MESIISGIVKNSPAITARKVSAGKFQTPKHIKLLDRILVEAAYRKKKRIIINMPPRHGKSELISKYFPFWYLGNFPTHRIILCSYEATFAAAWGRKVRDLIDSDGYDTFGIRLADGSSAIQNFTLEAGGSMNTAGAGGAITGKGADILIIDDPVKNDSEANSPTIRNNVWDWFLSTAFTRIEPDGVIIIVMTRWNEDDLCGRLEKDFSGDWFTLKLPAIAELDDPIGRLPGEALWQERFSQQNLLSIKQQIGSYWFSSLYQQSPSPASGAVFLRKHFKYFRIESGNYLTLESERKVFSQNDCTIYATVDLAISSGEKSDFTVVMVFAVSPQKDIFVFDIFRERLEATKHLEMIRNISAKYKCNLIGIESVQYQAVLLKQARNEGIAVKELKADKDKFTRALPIAALLEAGKVYFLVNAHWLGDFEKELLTFPNGKHDDQVDAFSYITSMYTSAGRALPAAAAKIRGIEKR